MITLRLLLGVLCTAGLDAAATTAVPTTLGTKASTTAPLAPPSPVAHATTTIKATVITTNPTTAAATTVPTTKATTHAPTIATKTVTTATVSITNTAPKTNAPTTGARVTPTPTNKQAITAVTTTQLQQTATVTPTHAGTTGHMTTSQPGVIKNVTSYSTNAKQSTTQETNVSNPTEKQKTTVSLPNTVTNVTYPIASTTAKETLHQSKATDAAKTIVLNTLAFKSTVSSHPGMMTSTTASLADASNYNFMTPTIPSPRTSSDFIAEHTYKDNISVKCKRDYNGTLMKINMNALKICTNNSQKLPKDQEEEKSFMYLCKALKPGYHPSKDSCNIILAYHSTNQLVIVDAFVENRLNTDELYEQLKAIKNQDNNALFSFDNVKDIDEDVVSIPLISAIVSLAVVLLIIAAVYGCWHQRQTWKREQRLTEELQTMENGYHDNPTLEVMETSPEMQEKKGGPNGELGDSWIVPLDNLREDLDEEDTHL